MNLVGTNVYLHSPPTPPSALIILCTWLGGASPRRIAKYTDGYTRQFPSAAILLITTTLPDIIIRSSNAIWQRLAPAREIIAQFLDSDSESGTIPVPVLLHIFSHGGSNIAIQLVQSIAAENPVLHGLLVSALRLVICDCCPGDSSFQRNYNAAAVSLPSAAEKPMAHTLGKSILYPIIRTITTLQSVGIMENVDDLRAELNNPALFGNSAKRLYLYSREDEMVRWEDVERHMNEGREKGHVVDGVRFDTGPHCALVVVDETLYWGSIRRAWEGIAFRSQL